MAKHIVTCVQCGRQFDANMGAYYNSSTRRYTCRSCGNKQKKALRAAAADGREVRTGMRQSVGAMIAKIAIGLVFIVCGTGDTLSTFVVALIIGGALIAWGLVPYLQARKQRQAEQAEAEAQAAAIQAQQEAMRSMPKKCTGCGAYSAGDVCEYCGSPLK